MRALKLADEMSGFNLDAVAKWSLTKDEITPELSNGDIFGLTLTVELINGDLIDITSLDVIAEFDAIVRQDEGRYVQPHGSIGYFVKNAKDYHNACERNEGRK